MDIEVQHDASQQLFYADVSGGRGELRYNKVNDRTLDYYSTYVPDDLRGHGLAATITQFALDFAREHHYKIIPSCSYVKSFIQRHTEYADLI